MVRKVAVFLNRSIIVGVAFRHLTVSTSDVPLFSIQISAGPPLSPSYPILFIAKSLSIVYFMTPLAFVKISVATHNYPSQLAFLYVL